MKIYTLTNEYPPKAGGIGIYIAGLKELLKDQLDIDVVKEFPRRFELLRLLRERTAQRTQIWTHHLFPVGAAAFVFNLATKRKYNVFLHGNDFDVARAHSARAILTPFILRGAQQVIVNSNALARDVESAYGIIPVILHPWLPTDAREALRPKQHAGHVLHVLTVGRFTPRKGFGLLIDVAKQAPEHMFTFAGPVNEYASALAARAHEEGIQNIRFVFNPNREQILQLYADTDIFAMPTMKSKKDREGFGIVYLEAQYAGLPIIAVNHPEMYDAIAPSGHSYLVQPEVQEILSAIRKMEDPKLRETLGAAGRDFVMQKHMAEQRKTILETILYA